MVAHILDPIVIIIAALTYFSTKRKTFNQQLGAMFGVAIAVGIIGVGLASLTGNGDIGIFLRSTIAFIVDYWLIVGILRFVSIFRGSSQSTGNATTRSKGIEENDDKNNV